jgi:UDP-N-acetylglucosamine 2-epimerase (non-hydrolysing)
MKIAPFTPAIFSHFEAQPDRFKEHVLAYTGQHNDIRMSESFFKDLNIPEPDINFEIGSGSHAKPVVLMMTAFEKVLEEQKPYWVTVVDDVNATFACSVTVKKNK